MTLAEKYPHLSAEVALVADQSDKLRIAYLHQDRFVPHPQAEALLSELEMLMNLPDAVRPQGRLIVGQSLMGKSTVLDEFARRHPADDNPNGNAAIVPVISVQYPETADEGIYPEILARLNAHMPTNSKPRDMRKQTVALLRQVGMRIILVDEVHNLLQGNSNAQRKGLNSIKYLANELRRPIVAAGTAEALNAINTDPQISSRLRPMILKRFTDDEEFALLLAGFELMLPLRLPSDLAFGDGELSSLIYSLTYGVVGHVSDLLNRASVFAIENGIDRITAEVLHEVEWGVESTESLKAKLG
jgi:hypothetical protein